MKKVSSDYVLIQSPQSPIDQVDELIDNDIYKNITENYDIQTGVI